jgi:small subunit ribosomal protein S20
MPKTTSVKKRARQNLRTRERSQQIKTRIKNLVRKVERSADWEKAIENLKLATKALDKAVKLKVIHKNKAGNTKSRLAQLANSIKNKAK